MAAKKNDKIHEVFRKDIQEIKVTMARIDEGVKRINGTVERQELAIISTSKLANKNTTAIAGIRGKITTIASGISIGISALVTLIISYFKN